jgi:aspartate/methionine/tyrosine aminotransferase
MDCAIEFHSLSKTFNMTGDRIGFAVGCKQLVAGLTKIKSQIDSGPPVYTRKSPSKHWAATRATSRPSSCIKTTRFTKNAATCW